MDQRALIDGLKQGDRTAFRQLVEAYQDRVYNTVLAIVRQPEEAEDVAQEVFVQVFRSVGQLGGEQNLTAWMYRIATTKALEAYRKRHARKRWGSLSFAFLAQWFGSGDDDGLPEQFHPVDWVHPGVKLEQQERATTLFRAVDRLPDAQKAAFTLHYVEGLSHVEIAGILQTSVSAVESLLHRAKQKLRKQLATYHQPDRTN